MARKLDNLGPELAAQIERAWARRDLEDWGSSLFSVGGAIWLA
jgi:hypothetical protein